MCDASCWGGNTGHPPGEVVNKTRNTSSSQVKQGLNPP